MPLAATTVTVAATPAYVAVLEPPATSYMLTTCALTSAWVGTAIPAEVRCAARTSALPAEDTLARSYGFSDSAFAAAKNVALICFS